MSVFVVNEINSLLILWTVVAPTFAIRIVIGINIRKAGIFIKPTLKGKSVLIAIPDNKNPRHPNIDIKKPIEAALPIALFIV